MSGRREGGAPAPSIGEPPLRHIKVNDKLQVGARCTMSTFYRSSALDHRASSESVANKCFVLALISSLL